MKSNGWLLAAGGLLIAAGNVATAADARNREPVFAPSASASRRAAEYFSKKSADPAPSSEDDDAEAAPPSTTKSTGYDNRLRPKTAATAKVTPASADDEESFGTTSVKSTAKRDRDEPSSDDDEPTFQKLRQQPRKSTGGRATVGSGTGAEASRTAPTKARTPSGAPLHRSPSPEEESSKVVLVNKTRDADEEWYDTQTGSKPLPVEDGTTVEKFLKNEPKSKSAGSASTTRVPSAGVKTTAAPAKSSESAASARPTESKSSATKSTSRGSVTTAVGSSRTTGRVTVPVNAEVETPTESKPTLLDEENSPKLTARWVKRSDINVGQPCECDLLVKNHGTVDASEVVVEARFPKSVRLTKADPNPTEVSDHLSWNFPALKAGEEKTIRISMVPTVKGELATTAHVRFTGLASGVFQVEEPMLALQVKGPKEVLVGDPASHIIVVSNPGSGVANGVVVEALIPKGLEHPRGERLTMEIGSLGPGESRTVRLALSAVQGGQHQMQVAARAESDLSQMAVADVLVVAPSIKLNLEGPSLRYIGRNATYILSAVNDGAAPSNNVRVMHKVPDGFKFVKADKGGKYDEASQLVSWFIGRLEPGQQSQVKLELAPVKLGTFAHQAGVVSEQGAKSQAECETVVDGTAALQLEIVEQSDPVEVGAEMVYEIRLKNNGSKAAQNVGISCETAAALQLVTAKGPTEFITENGLVVFKSLASLPAGKTVSYKVHVKGVAEGSHRFRVRLASDSITEPLISEELTKFYGE